MSISDRWIPSLIGQTPYDPELALGAHNAVEVCAGVRQGEHVTLITDLATIEIGASLWNAARDVGASLEGFVLEEESPRPLDVFPERILRAAGESDVVVMAIQPQVGEIASRSQLIEVVESRRIRYAHMVWISPKIMRQAMRADYREVDALSRRVLAHLRTSERIVVKSPAGTHIEATFNPAYTWIKTSGLIDPVYWSNLPGGEVWTAPQSVDGVFVVDGTVGDYLCPKYGDISSSPLTLEIEKGILRDARSDNPELAAEFFEYCRREQNGDRVGEFALGTNFGITEMIGNLLQDEKVPGVHIAFGNPLPNQTGVDWSCTTHIDAISRNTDVWADGTQIMAAARYLI